MKRSIVARLCDGITMLSRENSNGHAPDGVERNEVLGGIVPYIDKILPAAGFDRPDTLETVRRGLGVTESVTMCYEHAFEPMLEPQCDDFVVLDDLVAVSHEIQRTIPSSEETRCFGGQCDLRSVVPVNLHALSHQRLAAGTVRRKHGVENRATPALRERRIHCEEARLGLPSKSSLQPSCDGTESALDERPLRIKCVVEVKYEDHRREHRQERGSAGPRWPLGGKGARSCRHRRTPAKTNEDYPRQP